MILATRKLHLRFFFYFSKNTFVRMTTFLLKSIKYQLIVNSFKHYLVGFLTNNPPIHDTRTTYHHNPCLLHYKTLPRVGHVLCKKKVCYSPSWQWKETLYKLSTRKIRSLTWTIQYYLNRQLHSWKLGENICVDLDNPSARDTCQNEKKCYLSSI